jgi:cysteine synthase B
MKSSLRISSSTLRNLKHVGGMRHYSAPVGCGLKKTKVSFQTSLGEAPFPMPRELEKGIGNTPLVRVGERMFAKLEGHNPGGSIKDRTLSAILFAMLRNGELKAKGDTLVLVTSGSAGMSLTKIHELIKDHPDLELNIVVVLPKPYAGKKIPAEICALSSTTVFDRTPQELTERIKNNTGGSSNVLLLDGVFMDVLAETKKLAAVNGWKMLDQHYDDSSMMGHCSTAKELLEQVEGLTDVVCATGTGATAAGLRKYLPSHIKVHSRPAVSGSIDGLSDVNRYDNFCDTTKLEGYSTCMFDQETAKEDTDRLLNNFHIRAGPSSGATYWLAKETADKNPNAVVAFLCADGVMEDQAVYEDVERRPYARRARNSAQLGRSIYSPFFNGYTSRKLSASRRCSGGALDRHFSTTKQNI